MFNDEKMRQGSVHAPSLPDRTRVSLRMILIEGEHLSPDILSVSVEIGVIQMVE